MKLAGIALIVIGLVLAFTGGLSYQTRDTVVDMGPVEVTKEDTKRIPVSPVTGAVVAAVGLALVVFSGRKVSRPS